MPRSDDEFSKAKRYLLRLLRYRPRSRFEAEARLKRRGYPNETIHEVLAWAGDMGMIDDQAFARLWIADRQEHRPCGIFFLRHELREKGVSPDIIEGALEWAELDEEVLIRKLAAERLKLYRDRPPQERERKTFALLARRGFPPELSRRVLRELMAADLRE